MGWCAFTERAGGEGVGVEGRVEGVRRRTENHVRSTPYFLTLPPPLPPWANAGKKMGETQKWAASLFWPPWQGVLVLLPYIGLLLWWTMSHPQLALLTLALQGNYSIVTTWVCPYIRLGCNVKGSKFLDKVLSACFIHVLNSSVYDFTPGPCFKWKPLCFVFNISLNISAFELIGQKCNQSGKCTRVQVGWASMQNSGVVFNKASCTG